MYTDEDGNIKTDLIAERAAASTPGHGVKIGRINCVFSKV
jgi:hypothetical protein